MFRFEKVERNSENKRKDVKKFLYLTFDDGPNFGTPVVLDAFKAAGLKMMQIVLKVRIWIKN